jgi:MFS family permease
MLFNKMKSEYVSDFFSLDTGTIGPVTTMPFFVDTFGELSSTLHGFVVSSVLLSATIASLFAGGLSDGMGRTRAIAIGALIFGIGAALEAASFNLAMLIVGRLIVGAGEGLCFSTLVV